jgi:hypothetical protein
MDYTLLIIFLTGVMVYMCVYLNLPRLEQYNINLRSRRRPLPPLPPPRRPLPPPRRPLPPPPPPPPPPRLPPPISPPPIYENAIQDSPPQYAQNGVISDNQRIGYVTII